MAYIDLVKGIAILWVVLAHLKLDIPYIDLPVRMPCLFMLSALFFRPGTPPRTFIVKKTNALVVPLLFFWILSIVVQFVYREICSGKEIDWLAWTDILGEYSYLNVNILWFLMAAIMINAIYYVLFRQLKTKLGHSIIVAISMLLYVVGVYMFSKKIDVPNFPLKEIFYFQLYFVCGYLLRDYITGPKLKKLGPWMLGLFLILAVINVNSQGVVFQLSLPPMAVSFTIGMCWLMNMLQRFSLMKIFRFFGEFSIVVYLTHMLILYSPWMKNFYIPGDGATSYGVMALGIILAIEVVLVAAMRKFVPKLIGKKPLFAVPKLKV